MHSGSLASPQRWADRKKRVMRLLGQIINLLMGGVCLLTWLESG